MIRIITVLFFFVSVAAVGQDANSISGQINNSDNAAIVGAYIHVLNTDVGTTSDKAGKFAIHKLPAGKYKIEISAVGFATQAKELAIEEGVAPAELSVQLAEASTQLGEVVVTAQKQEEVMQGIASSISALSSRQIQQYRLWNIKDVTAIVPNFYSADPGDLRNVTSIRGITSTSYDPSVATYVDGVNQFGLDTYIPQLFDVERIEVLRGPQGTLYGRNAMGGVINIITRQPTNSTHGFAELNVGNYGQQRYSVGMRAPLIRNKLFFGVSGVYEQNTGFYKNLYDNSQFDKKHNLTGNYYLKYFVNDRWALTLNVKHSANRNYGTFPLASSPEDAFAQPFTVNQNAVTVIMDNVFNSSFTAAYAGQKMNFSSQSTYQSNYRYYPHPIDGDFSPYDFYTIVDNYGSKWNNTKVYTQEFKFTSPASVSSALNWTAGSYFYYQDSPVKQATHLGADAAPVAGDSLSSVIGTTRAKSKGLAFFGQASYAIMSRVEITAGLRYDYERKEQHVLGEYQRDSDPNSIFPIRPDTAASVSYGSFSPKFIVAYKPSTHNTLFASYNRGFRTGGLTSFSADPSTPPLYGYRPEYSNNYEVGVKNTFFANRLKINVAAFYINVSNAQIPTLVLPQAITITKNAGELTSHGLEIEVAATIINGLQIEYSGGLTHATYETLKLPEAGIEVDLKGNRQIFTPSSTSMLALQYQYLLGESHAWRLVARGEWMFVGNQYFDLANNIRQPGYSLLNTRFGVGYKNFEIMFWGRNLTNKKYISYAYDFGATHLGNPRTVGVTLSYRWAK